MSGDAADRSGLRCHQSCQPVTSLKAAIRAAAVCDTSWILCCEAYRFLTYVYGGPQSLDVFMAGEDVDKKKPDPMIYRIAAERLNVDPKQCLVVEDSTIGLQVTLLCQPQVHDSGEASLCSLTRGYASTSEEGQPSMGSGQLSTKKFCQSDCSSIFYSRVAVAWRSLLVPC